MSEEPISMSFCVSDSYSQHLAVTVASVLENNAGTRFVFNVLHSGVTAENQDRLRGLERSHPNCELRFHVIDAKDFEGFPIPAGLEHVTRETYFRYLLPEVLKDETRTIYSDVDVLCVADVREMWDVDLDGALMAAVRNIKGECRGDRRDIVKLGFSPDSPYFFTGFLVMDLEAMRAEGSSRRLMEATARHGAQVTFIDLDIMNLVCEGRNKEVPKSWNETGRYSFVRRDVKMWHFLGFTQKPWCNIWKNYTWLPYLKYLLKSPYRGNALRFVWGHVKGFFFFRYTKRGVTRCLVCGVLVQKERK